MNYTSPDVSLDVNVHVTADAEMRHVLYPGDNRATVHLDAYPCAVTLFLDADALAALDRAVARASLALSDARQSV